MFPFAKGLNLIYDSPSWSGFKIESSLIGLFSRNLVVWCSTISILTIDHLFFCPAESLNFPVVGIIDGKFDNGYFVTVTLGSEILRGVLYHLPPLGSASTSSGTPDNAIVPFGAPRLQRRRKRGKRRRDPAHPKPNRSAYNFFFAEKHSKLKLLYPQREREFSKMIGESWNKLTQEERMVGIIVQCLCFLHSSFLLSHSYWELLMVSRHVKWILAENLGNEFLSMELRMKEGSRSERNPPSLYD